MTCIKFGVLYPLHILFFYLPRNKLDSVYDPYLPLHEVGVAPIHRGIPTA